MTPERPLLTRRQLLAGVLTASGGAAMPRLSGAWAGTSSASHPFTLGIASGDPRASSVVLWTRLAPRPLQPDGGMGARRVRVEWELYTKDGVRRSVDSGAVYADPAHAHSVHITARNLRPATWYFYRFRALGFVSPEGRTRTLPAPGEMPDVFRFATVSCQNYQDGFYTAYRRLAAEKLDLVVHLGDYIYEDPRGSGDRPRYHLGGQCRTLDDYRIRHAQYRSDSDLQVAHERFPWIVTFDDHEVDNNWTGESHRGSETDAQFRSRREAAMRAYYEHMPLRRSSMPAGPDMAIYRSFDVGVLARISVLDTRQYRSAHTCLGPQERLWAAPCAEAADPHRTMTGPDQERWLLERMNRDARWNVVAQQVMMARLQRVGLDKPLVNMDSWDGYPAARGRILGHIAATRPSNPLVLTGDTHMHGVAYLNADFNNPASETLAVELLTTSISSGGDGSDGRKKLQQQQLLDPHLKFLSRRRGYVRHVVTPSAWRADFRILRYVSRRGAAVRTRASWRIRSGSPAAEEIEPV